MTNDRSRISLVFTLLFVSPVTALADDVPVPKHLELGRTLVANVSSENTSYKHSGLVHWKGDFLVSQYQAHVDCSGLINSLLERAESPTIGNLKRVARRGRPRAEDYYTFIFEQTGFKRIDSLTEVLPGDIIAVKYFERRDNTGHVMLVDAKPVLRKKNTKPIIDGTKQWEVIIIDSTEGNHGKGDTRVKPDGSKYDGVGRGTIRLYTNEQDQVVAYTASIAASSKIREAPKAPIAIGRPITTTP
jgi:hypothetical protein